MVLGFGLFNFGLGMRFIERMRSQELGGRIAGNMAATLAYEASNVVVKDFLVPAIRRRLVAPAQ